MQNEASGDQFFVYGLPSCEKWLLLRFFKETVACFPSLYNNKGKPFSNSVWEVRFLKRRQKVHFLRRMGLWYLIPLEQHKNKENLGLSWVPKSCFGVAQSHTHSFQPCCHFPLWLRLGTVFPGRTTVNYLTSFPWSAIFILRWSWFWRFFWPFLPAAQRLSLIVP